jgi:hypothetical protein
VSIKRGYLHFGHERTLDARDLALTRRTCVIFPGACSIGRPNRRRRTRIAGVNAAARNFAIVSRSRLGGHKAAICSGDLCDECPLSVWDEGPLSARSRSWLHHPIADTRGSRKARSNRPIWRREARSNCSELDPPRYVMADQIERKHFVPHVAISPCPATLTATTDRSRAPPPAKIAVACSLLTLSGCCGSSEGTNGCACRWLQNRHSAPPAARHTWGARPRRPRTRRRA